MEGDARLLSRPDESRRSSGRRFQRLQREPRAVQRRQMRHVDRRHGRRLLRDRQGLDGRRQGRLCAGAGQRPGQARQLAVGVVAGDSRRFRQGRRRREVRLLGDLEALHRARGFEGRLGQRASGHPQVALCECGICQGSVRQDDPRLHQLGGPDASHRQARPLRGRAVRRHPGIRGHCDRSRPGFLGRPRRHDLGSRCARQGSGQRDRRDDQGRLQHVRG